MVVIYTVPSSKYALPPAGGMPLDEIEIEGPPANKSTNQNAVAQFTLHVKTTQLTNVKASITLTRFQSIPAGAGANLGPAAGAVWTFQILPTAGPYEARWAMVNATDQLAQNTNLTFGVQFNTGNQPGIYRLTYRVEAKELLATTPFVETTFDMTVA
jgi:hypothetical protein